MTARTEPAGTEQEMRHGDWMTAATEEYRRLGALLEDLSDAEWRRPTDCSEWVTGGW